MDALRDLFPRITITKPFADHTDPLIGISYEPAPPDFTIRTIISRIVSVDPAFTASLYHPPTLEQRTRSMQLHEQATILKRLLFTFVIAIPTFIIGIVYMSLVPSGNHSKSYLMEPMWNGNASRILWSMFFLATPVMFYGAGLFHRRSIKEIVATWRKGSSTPIITRFTRFGSMNLLVTQPPFVHLAPRSPFFRFPLASPSRISPLLHSWHSRPLSHLLQTESVTPLHTLILSSSSPSSCYAVSGDGPFSLPS